MRIRGGILTKERKGSPGKAPELFMNKSQAIDEIKKQDEVIKGLDQVVKELRETIVSQKNVIVALEVKIDDYFRTLEQKANQVEKLEYEISILRGARKEMKDHWSAFLNKKTGKK